MNRNRTHNDIANNASDRDILARISHRTPYLTPDSADVDCNISRILDACGISNNKHIGLWSTLCAAAAIALLVTVAVPTFTGNGSGYGSGYESGYGYNSGYDSYVAAGTVSDEVANMSQQHIDVLAMVNDYDIFLKNY